MFYSVSCCQPLNTVTTQSHCLSKGNHHCSTNASQSTSFGTDVYFFFNEYEVSSTETFSDCTYMYLFGTECNDICVHGHQQTNKPVLVRMSKPWKSVNWPLPVNKITQS